MCGLLGVVSSRAPIVDLDADSLVRMRRPLRRRGPDAEGLWRGRNVLLAHHRLAVVDLSETGQQPMASACGRYRIVYNGELYNDAELRHELTRDRGCRFRGASDTETVLEAFAQFGPSIFARLRGMYALAIFDTRTERLHLARDPFGMKPLYYAVHGGEFVFASEPSAILAHPRISARPNWPMISAYLTTLRTVVGSQTMFAGVYSLQPGERTEFDAATGRLSIHRAEAAASIQAPDAGIDPEELASTVRRSIQDSIHRHLRSDVPVCSLLSGGLDSALLCYEIAQRPSDSSVASSRLRTWCAGSLGEDGDSEDFAFAHSFAKELNCLHHEVVVDRGRFRDDWPWMVEQLGVPLSTPNEVAIHAVSRDLRQRGMVVALSGEGADELFAGYQVPLELAMAHGLDPTDARSAGRLHLDLAAWIPVAMKERICSSEFWRGAGEDDFLLQFHDDLFAQCQEEVGALARPLEAHVRFLRHTNLPRLLQRLDTATMLASVEGRTPFCDLEVAALADSLPLEHKFAQEERFSAGSSGAGIATECLPRSKRILRQAWRQHLPESILRRPKASFPLPFERWMEDHADRLRTSTLVATMFDASVTREIANDPRAHFTFAWPMLNLAMWAERWWS